MSFREGITIRINMIVCVGIITIKQRLNTEKSATYTQHTGMLSTANIEHVFDIC